VIVLRGCDRDRLTGVLDRQPLRINQLIHWAIRGLPTGCRTRNHLDRLGGPSKKVGMTANHFRAWQAHMGWTNSETARRLQRTRVTINTYKANGAPLYIGLAAAALALGLKSWTPPLVKRRSPR
jgi:hypothetical protein